MAASQTNQTRRKSKKWIWKLLFVVLIVGVVASTAYADFTSDRPTASFSEIRKTLNDNFYYCLLALLCFVGVLFFETLKINDMIHELTGKYRTKLSMETAVFGKYYDYVTPFGAGGQPFQAIHLAHNGIPEGSATAIAITSFFSSQVAFFLLAVMSTALDCREVPEAVKIVSYVGMGIGVIVPIFTVLFSLFPKVGSAVIGFFIKVGHRLHLIRDYEATREKTLSVLLGNAESLRRICTKPAVFCRVLLYGIGEKLALYSIAYFVLRFFGFDIPANGFTEWFLMIQICSFIYAAVAFIPTPGNSGAADGTFYWLFCLSPLTMESTLKAGMGFPAMLTWRIFAYYLFLLVGSIVVWRVSRRNKRAALAAAPDSEPESTE